MHHIASPTSDEFSGAWLGAGTVHSQDHQYGMIMRSAFALCQQYQQLTVIVNHYDNRVPAHAPRGRHALVPQFENTAGHNRVGTTWVPGMKVLFWKLILTPEYVQRFKAVWMFDTDVAVHPSVFPLGSLMGVLTATGASVLQPSIRAFVHGTYHGFLRVKHAHMSCMATTARFVELMIPVFRMEAWAAVHRIMFAHLANADLVLSDHGIDLTWCALLASEFPDRPACLVTPSISALHTNTHQIEKFMNATVVKEARSCSRVCKTLQRGFRSFWANFSHDNKDCWGAAADGLRNSGGKFGLKGSTVKAQAPRKDLNASFQNDDPSLAVRYLGLTSMHSRDNAMGTMLAGLKSTLEDLPTLRIFINHFDVLKLGQSEPARSHLADSRIFFSRVPGGVVQFWHTVITEGVLDGISALWIFDAGLSVHSSSLPLRTLLAARVKIKAGVLQATVQGSTVDLISERQFDKVTAKRGGSCDATTIHAISFNSVLIAQSVWKIFMLKARLRLPNVSDQTLGRVVCDAADASIDPRSRFSARPSCVLLRAPALRLTQWQDRKSRHLDERPGFTTCFARGCPGTFGVNTSLAKHDDGRCWSISSHGYSPHGYRSPTLSQADKVRKKLGQVKMQAAIAARVGGRPPIRAA